MTKVDPLAELDGGTPVGYGTIIGPSVKIDRDCEIGPHCVLQGTLTIGAGTVVATGCVIGGRPRQAYFSTTEPVAATIVIGERSLLLEYVTVHSPIKEKTIIEKSVAIGPHSHIGHDSTVRTGAILSVGCRLGGYTIVGDGANLGLNVAVHPRLAIGAYAMCGMGAVITRHVLPGAVVQGVPARFTGVNVRGLERSGLSADEVIAWCHYLESGVNDMECSSLDGVLRRYEVDTTRWGRVRPTLPSFDDHGQS
jgi:UDP-N-acetylglucosamine acyltransferase